MLELQYFLLSWGRRPPFYRCIISKVSRSTPPLYRKSRSTKQTFQQKQMSETTVYKNKPFTKKKSLQYKPSPKNILHENGLQNKPFTKEHSPRKWSTKQTVHQKKGSTKQTFHQKRISKKSVYKTNCSPKKHLQKNGLQNKPSTKKNSRKRSTKKALATNVPQENAQHKGLGPKHAEDQTILVICRGCVK